MIPGSGRLDDHQRELLARVQQAVVIEPGTIMLKVLRPGSVQRYLQGEVSPGIWRQVPPFDYRLVGGMVARRQDCAQLRTPAEFTSALRLDYPASPFHPSMPSLQTMEFPALRPSQFVTPFGAPSPPYPAQGFPPDHPQVMLAAARMAEAAERAGVDPNTFRTEIRPWPFTGTGVTAEPASGVPERWRRFGPAPQGATVFEHSGQGHKQPLAVFRGAALGWEQLR
jgi:hypothetical protein